MDNNLSVHRLFMQLKRIISSNPWSLQGLAYLYDRGVVEQTPESVAAFLYDVSI